MTDAECRTSLAIDLCALGDGCAFQHVGYVAFDVVQFVSGQHPLEYVETTTGIGLQNVGVEIAVGIASYRPTVT